MVRGRMSNNGVGWVRTLFCEPFRFLEQSLDNCVPSKLRSLAKLCNCVFLTCHFKRVKTLELDILLQLADSIQ